MSEAMKEYVYLQPQNIPIYTNEEIVDSQESFIDVVNGEDIEVDAYEAEEEDGVLEDYYFQQMEALKKVKKDSFYGRKLDKIDRIANSIANEKVDLIEVGTSVMVGTSDRTLNHSAVEKAVKNGVASAPFLGDISIEALVEGMSHPPAADGRYAMLGASVMWNALKSNIRDLKGNIIEHTHQTHTEGRFDGIDLNLHNVPFPNNHMVKCFGVFSRADLYYIFSLLNFRKTAKLLNKTKQFLKAYFIIACRPRCMIWRYTFRRSGNTRKKVIQNLPSEIVDPILNFLIHLTGIGSGDMMYHTLDPRTPFYQSLGEDFKLREQRYYDVCKQKDALITFFRNTITDVLNEIREMPFSLNTGSLISPLRGRAQSSETVMWKDYEAHLKRVQEKPTDANYKARRVFEQRLCDIGPQNVTIIRR